MVINPGHYQFLLKGISRYALDFFLFDPRDAQDFGGGFFEQSNAGKEKWFQG
jgi:hypothetical protein